MPIVASRRRAGGKGKALEAGILTQAALAFPAIDPTLFSIGPLSIHWYGVGYVVGIVFAWWYAKRLAANRALWGGRQAPIGGLDLDDFVVWAAIGVIVGGRLGYVLFYVLLQDPRPFLDNPLGIFAVWQGGMSFHGGIAGVTIAMIVFALRRGFSPFSLFDVVAAGVPVGLGIVRVANFIKPELWGRSTDVPWGVVFPGAGDLPRHPSQLYEAVLEGLVLFVILRICTHRFGTLQWPGLTAGIFIAGYGAARIFVENFREPDIQIGYLAGGWLTMGMVLSLPMVLLGLWLVWRARRVPAGA